MEEALAPATGGLPAVAAPCAVETTSAGLAEGGDKGQKMLAGQNGQFETSIPTILDISTVLARHFG